MNRLDLIRLAIDTAAFLSCFAALVVIIIVRRSQVRFYRHLFNRLKALEKALFGYDYEPGKPPKNPVT